MPRSSGARKSRRIWAPGTLSTGASSGCSPGSTSPPSARASRAVSRPLPRPPVSSSAMLKSRPISSATRSLRSRADGDGDHSAKPGRIVVTEATVAKWLKQPGEAVAIDEPVAELETDKITLEVYAPAAGTLAVILAEEGANVPVGAVLGRISEGVAAGTAPHPPADAGPSLSPLVRGEGLSPPS